MKTTLLTTVMLLILMISIQPCYSKTIAQVADTTRNKEVKSFFLLRLNLETDPVDLQNYLQTQNFRKEVQAFARFHNDDLVKMDQEQANALRWAITDALNGNFDLSIKSFNQYLGQESALGNPGMQLGIHQLISLILEMKGNYDAAGLEQQKALDWGISTKSAPAIVQSYIRLGKIKSLQRQYDEADRYLIKKALPAVTRLKDQEGIVACYREIGDRYNREELFSRSLWFYLQSLTSAQKANYHLGTILALIEIGQLKYETGDFEPAIRDWQQAEKLAISQHELPQLLRLKWGLALALKQNDDFILAEKYAMEFKQLKDILLNPGL